MWIRIFGGFFAVVGGIMAAVIMSVAKGGAMFAAIIPGLFVLIGLAVMVLGAKAAIKQAERGWYAVTNRRAIVFSASIWGDSGDATTYEPEELRRMRVQKSSALPGGGDLIFRTEVSHHTRTERDARGRTRTSTSTSTQHFGFLGIENVREVETLVHNILLDD